jgi:hypothetical protein
MKNLQRVCLTAVADTIFLDIRKARQVSAVFAAGIAIGLAASSSK